MSHIPLYYSFRNEDWHLLYAAIFIGSSQEIHGWNLCQISGFQLGGYTYLSLQWCSNDINNTSRKYYFMI